MLTLISWRIQEKKEQTTSDLVALHRIRILSGLEFLLILIIHLLAVAMVRGGADFTRREL